MKLFGLVSIAPDGSGEYIGNPGDHTAVRAELIKLDKANGKEGAKQHVKVRMFPMGRASAEKKRTYTPAPKAKKPAKK